MSVSLVILLSVQMVEVAIVEDVAATFLSARNKIDGGTHDGIR